MVQQCRLYVCKFNICGPSNLTKNLVLGDRRCDVLTGFRYIAQCCRRPTISLSTAFKRALLIRFHAAAISFVCVYIYDRCAYEFDEKYAFRRSAMWRANRVSPYCTMLQTTYNISRHGVQRGTPDTLPCCSNIVCVFKFTTGGPSNLTKNVVLGDLRCDGLTGTARPQRLLWCATNLCLSATFLRLDWTT